MTIPGPLPELDMPSTVIVLDDPLFERKMVKVSVVIHKKGPIALRGNKWHKLKYNLVETRRQGEERLLTFGGAFSNHIAAVAQAAALHGFKSTGIIRGEVTNPLNKTLREAMENGMKIIYESRDNYRLKNTPEYLENLRKEQGSFYMIPEGGSNLFALKGCREWIEEVNISYDYICCACGTGATLAGLITGMPPGCEATGISVLKGAEFINAEISSLLDQVGCTLRQWKIIHDYHSGGYAKSNQELENFIYDFIEKHKIQVEPVYTGKMFYGLNDLISKDYYRPGSHILAFHTGGLQYLE